VRYLPVFALLLTLISCGGRPHPKGYYDLLKVEDSLKADNQKLYAKLQERTQGAEDHVDTFPVPPGYEKRPYVRLLKVKKAVLDMNHYLDDLKVEVFTHVDGNTNTQATMMGLKDMLHPGNTSTTTHYFIGDDADNVTGAAKTIREKLVQLRDLLIVYAAADPGIKTDALRSGNEIVSWDKKEKSWEVSHFYDATAAEAYVELTRLQNLVLSAGNEAMDKIQH
jgi:hypothetical protein